MAPGADQRGRRLMHQGSPGPLGATADRDGVNFAICSSVADAVELCLFDGNVETDRLQMPAQTDGVWHGYLPGCATGQAYGFRVHGAYAPERGLRCNPHKLLLDPYARQLRGEFHWSPEVFDYEQTGGYELLPSSRDSAASVPKSVVVAPQPSPPPQRPCVAWRDTVIYEANVRGYTMRHPDLPDADRGTFRGMRNGCIVDYLAALGVTTLELMPVQAFIDERHLQNQGLRNLWGYNAIGFFAPAARYLAGDAVHEFREMVDAIHDAGIEVILDVAFNHTGEGDRLGPTLSFRGIDNLAYYRTSAGEPGEYINDTGCGNTINADHPVVQRLVLDSLHYWSGEMGVDGFRFDLAPVLGRTREGFSAQHPLLRAIAADSKLAALKLIAEPWDPGPGGYRLGEFPEPFAEWNDRYRDSVRRFWRGDAGEAQEFARRLHGSADIFEASGRTPSASVNFVTCHDGFTLRDVVSYERRHNDANGEQNRDGHEHNFSDNNGVEGDTDDAGIRAERRRQRLNLLATLLLSQGTPMLLAGDELGHSQHGNNNAYAQDNELGWVDWSGRRVDPDFVDSVRGLIRLRRVLPLLGRDRYVHGDTQNDDGWPDIAWLGLDGTPLGDDAWRHIAAFSLLLTDTSHRPDTHAVAVLVNAARESVRLSLAGNRNDWELAFASADITRDDAGSWHMPARSIACIRSASDGTKG